MRPERKCPATLRPVRRCRGELRPGAWCRGELRPNSHCMCVLRWERYVRCQGVSRVSLAPGASGRSLCVQTHIFFPDVLSAFYSLSSLPLASSSPSSSSSCSSRHVVFANFPLFPTRRAMLLRSKQHYHLIATMGVTLGACAWSAKCGTSIYRCTLDIENRTGLSHYTWNPLCVCECEASICCDVLRLDSQRDRGAMTCVVWTRPVGKCPDTAASRRKMP